MTDQGRIPETFASGRRDRFAGQGSWTTWDQTPDLDADLPEDNGALEITDGVLILNVLFPGAGVIPPPGPTFSPCGVDPTPDGRGCLRYDRCE